MRVKGSPPRLDARAGHRYRLHIKNAQKRRRRRVNSGDYSDNLLWRQPLLMTKFTTRARLLCGLLGHRPNLLPAGNEAGAFYVHHSPCRRCGYWVPREM